MFLYIFCIIWNILPLILFNNNLYHKPSRHTLSKAFSKSIKTQYIFFFFHFKSSKKAYNVKILSIVQQHCLKPHWFSFRINKLSEYLFNRSVNTAVKSLSRQLTIVIGRQYYCLLYSCKLELCSQLANFLEQFPIQI